MISREIEELLDEIIIKQCLIITIPQRLWGAWQVLCGKADIVLVKINKKNLYKPSTEG